MSGLAEPDPAHLATIAAALGTTIGPVVVHDHGMDTRAYEVDGWIFRFARDAAMAERLARESRLLDAIAPRMPTAIPRHTHRGPDFVGYRMITGTPLRGVAPRLSPAAQAVIARDIGLALRALHETLLTVARECDLPREDPPSLEEFGAIDAEFAELIGPHLSSATVRRCQEEIRDYANWTQGVRVQPVVLHNDFLPDWHVFVDEGRGRLSGIIDFADAATGDPAFDLAPLAVDLPPSFLDQVLAAYGDTATAFRDRCVRRGRAYALFDAHILAKYSGIVEPWRMQQITAMFG